MRRLTPATILIVLIFGAATVLAWQAYTAARSHRQSTERVIHDYVQFAAWEFERVAQTSLTESLDQWAQPVVDRDGTLLTPAAFNARPACKCSEIRAVTTFRQTASGFDTIGEPLTPEAGAWLTALAAAAHGSGPRRSFALHLENGGGRLRAVITRTMYQPSGTATPLQGYVFDAPPFQRVFRDLLARRPLLPATLAGENNALVVVTVRAPGGAVLYSSGDPAVAGADSRVTGQLADALGGIAYDMRLKPEAAGRLVIGGLPRSRLPLLAGLLALTGALAIAALLQLRREHQLAVLRSDFVSSVSHELRTPLAQIRLFSDTLLLNRIRSESEGRRAIEIIQHESRRLAHLVENVLCFSRSERGVERLSLRPLPLAPIVTEVVDGFLPLARSAASDVRLEIEPVDAFVDSEACRQILLNLLDNAVKYGLPGQTIVVRVARGGENAEISVSDQGPGVPADARTRIFAPYTRLVTAASTAVAGTGIGLAVVHELARLHGGSVRVDDAPGGGACFVVELRAADAAAAVNAAAAARAGA